MLLNEFLGTIPSDKEQNGRACLYVFQDRVSCILAEVAEAHIDVQSESQAISRSPEAALNAVQDLSVVDPADLPVFHAIAAGGEIQPSRPGVADRIPFDIRPVNSVGRATG